MFVVNLVRADEVCATAALVTGREEWLQCHPLELTIQLGVIKCFMMLL